MSLFRNLTLALAGCLLAGSALAADGTLIRAADLKAKGFHFTVPPTDSANLRIAFFKGPDGVVVEIVSPLK